MNTPLSLVQELRGIRGGQKHSQSELEGLLSEIREARREWQEQVDQAQHLLHELIGAVAELSGVEVPGVGVDGLSGETTLRLGFKTLKDRIKNELEAFAHSSAAEVAKQAQGLSHLVLDPLQKEMSARMDTLAEEFRGKLKARLEAEQNEVANQAKVRTEEMLQGKMNEFAEWIKLMTEGIMSSVPAEVQKSIQPHIEAVKEGLKSSFQQHLNMVMMEAERAAHSRVDGLKDEVQSLVNGLAEQARQACSQSAEQTIREFNGRLGAMVQDSARQVEASSRAFTEENLTSLKTSVAGLLSASKDELQSFANSQVAGFKDKLQAASQELQQKNAAEMLNNLQKASQDALNASVAQVQQRFDEALQLSKGELRTAISALVNDARRQVNEFALSVRDTLGREAAEVQMDEIRKSVASLQARMAMEYEAQLRQFMETQRRAMIDEIQRQVADASASAVEKIKTSTGQVVQDLSGKVNKEVNTATTLLNQWAHQTTTWAEASIKESLESYKRQVSEFTNALLEEQRGTVQKRIGDLQARLEQAANLLRLNEASMADLKFEKGPNQI
jgi:hypothetical protein